MELKNNKQELMSKNGNTQDYNGNDANTIIESILNKCVESMTPQNFINDANSMGNNFNNMDYTATPFTNDYTATQTIDTPQNISRNRKLAEELSKTNSEQILREAEQALTKVRQFSQSAQQRDYSKPILKTIYN